MKKKSFLKTIEILLVIIVTTIFALSIIQKNEKLILNKKEAFYNDYLLILERDDTFRNYVLKNSGCFNITELSESKGFDIDYYFYFKNQNKKPILCIESRLDESTNFLSSSILMTGNITNLKFSEVIIYYFE